RSGAPPAAAAAAVAAAAVAAVATGASSARPPGRGLRPRRCQAPDSTGRWPTEPRAGAGGGPAAGQRLRGRRPFARPPGWPRPTAATPPCPLVTVCLVGGAVVPLLLALAALAAYAVKVLWEDENYV